MRKVISIILTIIVSCLVLSQAFGAATVTYNLADFEGVSLNSIVEIAPTNKVVVSGTSSLVGPTKRYTPTNGTLVVTQAVGIYRITIPPKLPFWIQVSGSSGNYNVNDLIVDGVVTGVTNLSSVYGFKTELADALAGVWTNKIRMGAGMTATRTVEASGSVYYTLDSSVGSGDSVFVNGVAATDANFLDGAGIAFTHATAPNPDTVTAAWSPSTYVADFTLWNSANASRKITAGLSGTRDSTIDFHDNSLMFLTNYLVVTNNRVGVGTATPGGTFHIFQTAGSGINPELRITQDSIAGLQLYEVNGGGDIYFDSWFDSALGGIHFRARTLGVPVEHFYLKNSGLVNLPLLTASKFVKTDANKDLVSADIVDADVPAAITRDAEWDTEAEVQTAWGAVNIILATEIDTSAEIAAIVTDETGSGALVLGTSPTIVTPNIASLVNANHNHQNAAGGGTLDAAAIAAGTLPIARGGTAGATAVAALDSLITAETDVVSAATTDLGAVASRNVRITGTVTITSFGTVAAGVMRFGRFAGALTLTHNATSLILPSGANITTAANDRFIAISLGAGNWLVYNYTEADGTALVGGGGSSPTTTRGDMISRGATGDERLAIGGFGDFLVSDGVDPMWRGKGRFVEQYSDFLQGANNYWQNSANAFYNIDSIDAAAPGLMVINANNAHGGVSTHLASTIFGSGKVVLDIRVRITRLSVAGDFVLRVGFGDTSTATAFTDGVWFEYTDNVNTGNWVAKTKAAATSGSANMAVGPAINTWYKMRIEIAADGDTATFKVNDANSVSISTLDTIPDATSEACGIVVSCSSTSANLTQTYVDYVWFGQLLTAGR